MKGQTGNLDPELTDILKLLEVHMGFELTITSGYRTHEHNDDPKVGGVKNSEHTTLPSKGADVLCTQSVTRYKMVKWLVLHDMRRIGVGKDFVHVGVSRDLPGFVMWTYYADTAEPETPKAVLA